MLGEHTASIPLPHSHNTADLFEESAENPKPEPEPIPEPEPKPIQALSKPVVVATKRRAANGSPPSGDFVSELKREIAYQGLDVDRESQKCDVWCRAHGKQMTKRRFVNWLNNCDYYQPSGNGSHKPESTGPYLPQYIPPDTEFPK